MNYEVQNNHEMKKKCKCLNILSRKLNNIVTQKNLLQLKKNLQKEH